MDWEREKTLNGVQRFHKTFRWFAAITQCFFSGSWYRDLSGGLNVLDPSRMGTVGYQGGGWVQKYWGYIINLLIIIINGRTFREDFLGRIGSPWGGDWDLYTLLFIITSIRFNYFCRAQLALLMGGGAKYYFVHGLICRKKRNFQLLHADLAVLNSNRFFLVFLKNL